MALGRNHPMIRRLRALRKDRALRDREGVFVAEGVHLAIEALAARADVKAALYAPPLRERPEGPDLLDGLSSAGVEAHEVSPRLMNSLQDARSPQPVVLVVTRPSPGPSEVIRGRGGTPLVAVACGVQEPGNLGSIWRTADAAGATGLLVTGASADLYHPRTVRATQGSIFRLPAATLAEEDLLPALRSQGLASVAATPRAGEPYDEPDLRGPTALLFGSEGGGLPPALDGRFDRIVRIPMHPGVESLSVVAAAAVLLFEASRQRRGSPV